MGDWLWCDLGALAVLGALVGLVAVVAWRGQRQTNAILREQAAILDRLAATQADLEAWLADARAPRGAAERGGWHP
jgi:sensor domain CHASE-containing protein